MARIGKIARLPRSIRDELNRRLENGAQGKQLIVWLNQNPEVQAVLAAEFAGRPLNAQNLTEWKQGGFRDWQDQQQELELARELAARAGTLATVSKAPLSDVVTPLLLMKQLLLVPHLNAINKEDPESWRLLHTVSRDLQDMRRGDHSAERIKIDREKLALAREQLQFEKREAARQRKAAAKQDEIATKEDFDAIFKEAYGVTCPRP